MKIFTLCMALMALTAVPATAQDNDIDNTIQFTDADGNVVEDGSTITVNDVEASGFGDAQIKSGLYVKNNSSSNVTASMEINITSLPSGQIQCCFPLNCMMYSATGSYETTAGNINANVTKHDIQTEWMLSDAAAYGTAKATFRIKIYIPTLTGTSFKGYGPSVTVNFVNPDPTGIQGVSGESAKANVAAIYNLRGEQLSAPQKGVNIIRYADGTTKKVIK